MTVKDAPVQAPARDLQESHAPSLRRRLSPLALRLMLGALSALLGATGYFGLYQGDDVPGKEELKRAFAPLTGYEYAEVPPEMMNAIRGAIDRSPTGAELVFDVRTLMQGPREAGLAMVFGTTPGTMSAADRTDFVFGFQHGSGMSLQSVAREGTTMYEATGPEGAFGMFFDEQDGLVVTVATRDLASMRSIITELARATL